LPAWLRLTPLIVECDFVQRLARSWLEVIPREPGNRDKTGLRNAFRNAEDLANFRLPPR
jgi:hypothetical protein